MSEQNPSGLKSSRLDTGFTFLIIFPPVQSYQSSGHISRVIFNSVARPRPRSTSRGRRGRGWCGRVLMQDRNLRIDHIQPTRQAFTTDRRHSGVRAGSSGASGMGESSKTELQLLLSGSSGSRWRLSGPGVIFRPAAFNCYAYLTLKEMGNITICPHLRETYGN